MSLPTEDEMRALFRILTAEKEKLIKETSPMREMRDNIRKKIAPLEAEERALNAEIKRIEQPLFDVQMQIGQIVRALKGKTGPVVLEGEAS